MFRSFVAFAARLCLAAIFLFSGYQHLLTPKKTIAAMASAGVPYAKYLYIPAMALVILSGLLLLLGARARFAALGLILYLIPATLYFHLDFASQGQLVHLLKNLAILGGLFHVLAFGAGRMSLDRG